MLQKPSKLKNRQIEVLVLVPTRELATQIQEVTLSFTRHLSVPIKSLAVFGGVSINPQMIGMQGVRMLIATPGRLLDLIKSKALSLEATRLLVVDEADKMLNMGFKEEMDEILAMLPKKRQNLLFSATLSKEVELITQVILQDPEVIKVEAKTLQIDLISQRAYAVSEENKGPLLRELIISQNMQQVLIFTSSKQRADRVAEKLFKNGIDARSTHGDKSQGARNAALFDFKQGELRVLVATDLLSRGIDIAFLPYVINYELPRSPKDYIHRIGRTGRAENPGQAIALITPEEEHHFKVIQKKMKTRVELEDGNQLLA
jgi:ATP-dependent RNA helicase RhlE